MVNRFVVCCVVVAALTIAAPAHAWVFPFFEPPERLDATVDKIVALDFNGDGWPDIAGVHGPSGQATLVLNGEEGFEDARTAGLGGPTSVPVAVAAGDLDGDGRDELLATLGESGALAVFRGRASGELGTPELLSLRAPQPVRATAVAVADVDGDGDRDVVAAFGDSATVLVNDGHGRLTPSAGAVAIPSPYDLALIPLAGDDDPDLVVLSGRTLTVLPGAAGASFDPPETHDLGAVGSALATGDVDRDGRLDVGVVYRWLGAYPSSPAFLRGADDAGLVPVPGGAQTGDALLLADFDGDGALDRYTTGYKTAFAHGVGTFGLLPSAGSDSSHWETALAAADFDRDGKLDVASVESYPRTLLVRYSTGPQLVPSDANTWFGETTVGYGGGMIAVPVRNEGGGVARHLTPVIEGDAEDFKLDLDTCGGAVLKVDDQCWMRVYFRPKSLGERAADIGLVAEDSGILWMVTFAGEGIPAPPEPPAQVDQPVIHIDWDRQRPVRTATPAPIAKRAPVAKPTPVAAVRPGVPTIARRTLATLRRSGLRFTQDFRTSERVTWTLEHRGTVLARAQRTVPVGRISVALKLTAAGKRVLVKRKPTTLTLRTKGTLERVTTVKLRRG